MKLVALALVLFAEFAAAVRVVHSWDITYVSTARGLDQPPRRGIGVNGELPLPQVVATRGDTLVLNVHNSLDVPTSLHAHGIFQNGTVYYDGAGMTTECGIAPGGNFTYEIPLKQSGTFWIHSHVREQQSDGLRTSLIVYDPEEPYKYDSEHVFVLEDWLPSSFPDVMQVLDKSGPGGIQSVPPSKFLINGVSGNLTKPIQFEPGKVYRIRLIGIQALFTAEFRIDDHDLEIIEIDGVATKPKATDAVLVAPGQRVSILVRAKNDARYSYLYRIRVFADFIPPLPGYNPAAFSNRIEYGHNTPLKAIAAQPSKPVNDLHLEPLDEEPELIPDRVIFLNLNAGQSIYNAPAMYINYRVYAPPLVPSIFSALSMGSMARNPIIYGPQTNAHVLKHMEVVELLLWGPGKVPHPMHLHGHNFQIIERGFTNDTDGSFRKMPAPGRAPSRRDTVVVAQGEYAVIRFRADNPGIWHFHCHIDLHMALGINMIFVEAPDVLQKILTVPDSVVEQCRLQNITYYGNAAGKMGYNYDGAPDAPDVLPLSVKLNLTATPPTAPPTASD
ncbi:hypothetical protein GQ54DRAFT_286729 [Martensiomyces pterosporus]|nr:hypothetical protein GQ54DRAFT_286729 [Martensiomyces pterosporus]